MRTEPAFPAAPALEPVSILVVEDDRHYGELLRMQLRRMPGMRCRLEIAASLREALDKLASEPYSLVVADLNLPDSRGLDTLGALARAGDQPVIVLTGDADPAMRAGTLDAGAYDFLSKDNVSAAALERLVRLASLQANTQRLVRETESRFRSLVALSTDFYWESDAEHRVVKIEHGAERHSAVNPGQLGKARWEMPSNWPDADGWAAHRATLDARLPFRDFEVARRDDDGQERWRSLSGDPIFDARGVFTGYRGIGRDVTARKRAEEELQRFRLAMDQSADMIVLIDRGTMRFIDFNHTACRLLGYSREELLALGPQDLLPVSRESLERHYDELIADPLRASGMNSHYRCKDGSLLPFESTRRVLRSGGGWIIAAISRDIRERIAADEALRRSEARFRSLSELSADWFWQTDAEHRFLDTPPRVTEITGYTAPTYVGKRRWEIPGLSPMSGDWSAHRRVLERRESYRDLELVQVRPGGSRVYLQVSGEPVFDAEGRFEGYRGTARDISARKREEEELRRFRAAMDLSVDAIYLTDRATLRFLDANEAACRGVGYSREQLLGMSAQDLLRKPGAELEREYDDVIAHGAAGARTETSYVGSDGRTRWTELHRRALREADRWIIVTVARDITERKGAEERQIQHLRRQERIARFGQSALGKRAPAELIDEAVQNVLEGLDADAVAYLERGAAARELVVRALVGAPAGGEGSFVAPSDSPALRALESGETRTASEPALPLPWGGGLRSAAFVPVRGEGGARGVLCVARRAVQPFALEALNFVEAAASVLSTGLQRIESEGRLAYLAQFDSLTGLPNRALLADRFSQMIEIARRHASTLGVLFVDLDEFKMVNDTLGHAGGDELLKEVAVRLQGCVRSGDTVARISGDEFAVILADMARPEDAALVAQKIIDRLGAAFDIHGQEAFVSASIGIAAYPGDGDEAETLLGAADAAMYRAKQAGRNGFQFFTADINQRTRARAQLGVELRRALEREEFVLFYQPKIDLTSRRLHGAEALLRWKHPERGLVSPAEFIPVLEESGLIVQVGEWVLRRACEDIKAWRAAGLDPGPIAVNLSARQFRLQDLHTRIGALVQAAGIDPWLIELEITESHLMQDPDHAVRVMRALCAAGMRIAIDDFGTGYSSLAYLTRFPVGALKIDRSFVADVNDNAQNGAIVRTIIEMAHTLGFTVVAEGIETEAQARYLRSHGCEQAQGFLFAKPMPAAELAKLLGA